MVERLCDSDRALSFLSAHCSETASDSATAIQTKTAIGWTKCCLCQRGQKEQAQVYLLSYLPCLCMCECVCDCLHVCVCVCFVPGK